MFEKGSVLAFIGVLAAFCLSAVSAWGSGDSVLLKDIQVLTLYNGKSTTGGRSSPVPQLECVKGGTAPCGAFHPRVVQCYNRGWDGSEVQWECKTDMDNAYRFGEIEVSCEGYSHRDDPYVLKGSCGLRYTIDYTKEGMNQQSHHHNYYGDHEGHSSYSQKWNSQKTWTQGSWLADMIVFVAVVLMCWAFYKTCLGSRHAHEGARSTTNDDYPGGHGGGGAGYGWFGQGGGNGHYPTAPPHSGDDASCGNATRHRGRGGGGGGGFWTGALTGGLLGYMFGNRGGRNYTGGGWGTGGGGWRTGGGGNWGGSGGGFSGGGFSGGGSTGTRTASGFGGTSRR